MAHLVFGLKIRNQANANLRKHFFVQPLAGTSELRGLGKDREKRAFCLSTSPQVFLMLKYSGSKYCKENICFLKKHFHENLEVWSWYIYPQWPVLIGNIPLKTKGLSCKEVLWMRKHLVLRSSDAWNLTSLKQKELSSRHSASQETELKANSIWRGNLKNWTERFQDLSTWNNQVFKVWNNSII